MKILWITNILFPEVVQLLTGKGDLRSSGGWMLGAADALLQKKNCRLFVATVSSLVSSLTIIQGKEIKYYILPLGKGNTHINLDYVSYWKQVQQEVQPDVVHIHGTEFSHGHAYMLACGNSNVVLSIQGLTSVVSQYYLGGLTKYDIFKNLSFKNLIRGSMLQEQKEYYRRGKVEIETIKMSKHIIGRTSWDKAHVWSINPNANYHFCNEILRSNFYDGTKWNYDLCDNYSIFLSQAYYPIKGLHQVIKALPFVLQHYPNTKIRVAGEDLTSCSSFYDKLRISNYGFYLKRLISNSGLNNKIKFLGNLSSEEMKKEYLSSNVFICSSCIENSSNSLGEAQILGVPCIASYVGGNPDMMCGNEENLYRYEDVVMLAHKICEVFNNKEKQIDMSPIAQARHDSKSNSARLLEIYSNIIANK